MRSNLCVELWPFSDSLCKQSKKKSHWIITINGKINVCKCKLIFPTDTLLQQSIEITDLKTFFFLPGENTSVLIILATTVYLCNENNLHLLVTKILIYMQQKYICTQHGK